MEVRKVIAQYLQDAKLMQLATISGDKPWVSSVWFAADNEFNIYWFSSITRRHSNEVGENSSIAASIVLPQTPSDPPRGLQIEGIGEVLSDNDDIAKARGLYAGRIFDAVKIDALMASAERPHRFYRLRPNRIVLLDPVNFSDSPTQELTM